MGSIPCVRSNDVISAFVDSVPESFQFVWLIHLRLDKSKLAPKASSFDSKLFISLYVDILQYFFLEELHDITYSLL